MKMTTVQYYRLSWLLPVMLPLFASSIEALFNSIGVRFPDMVSNGIGIASLAVMFFLIPYAALVAILLVGLHNRSEKMYRLALVNSPLLMILLIFLFISIADRSGHDVIGMTIFYARYALVVGYSYVALIFLLLWFLRRMRIVREAS